MNARTARAAGAARLTASTAGRIVAASAVTMLALVAVYGVVGAFTGVPHAITSGDAPRFDPLTGLEDLEVTGSDHHHGDAATRILLSARPGEQGATFTAAAPTERRIVGSLWIRGEPGRAYVLAATQDQGHPRGPRRRFVTTGKWQPVSLEATLEPGDSLVQLTVYRAPRGGEEALLVDDVRVAPRRR